MTGMNRAQQIEWLAFAEALAKAFRANLMADAVAEFEEQGTAPSWRGKLFQLSASTTNDAVTVADPAAFLRYVEARYPTEVETVKQVRSAWLGDFLKGLAAAGDPPMDDEGSVIPGLVFQEGGAFKTVALTEKHRGAKASVAELARLVASGEIPLVLPTPAAAPAEVAA